MLCFICGAALTGSVTPWHILMPLLTTLIHFYFTLPTSTPRETGCAVVCAEILHTTIHTVLVIGLDNNYRSTIIGYMHRKNTTSSIVPVTPRA
ncbi:hypothetical protein PFISCL1PPCAC_26295 [Pristionchus fissidentatus]|uniref:G protein-coupled receptor n=1 Tax=Pristionchus fissidentatus TaxID=1538716 RepID=A0AAV5WUJ6_9BILA|nr:hypothetical protein PFISCL1PPCAC_26295 [Pristionchus fissidentatus]